MISRYLDGIERGCAGGIISHISYVPASELAEREKFWQQVHRNSIKPMMLLQDRKDLCDAAGVRVGGYIAEVVPWLVAEYDSLTSKLAEADAEILALKRRIFDHCAGARAGTETK